MTSQISVAELDRQVRPICPTSTILLSTQAEDSPIAVLEQHLFPAFEQPEVTALGHILSVHLSDAMDLEHCSDGAWQCDRLQPQDICLTPSGTHFQARWQDVAESIVIKFDDDWLNSIAEEVFLSDSCQLTLQRCQQDKLVYYLVLTLRNEVASNYQSGKLYYDSILNTLGIHLVNKYGIPKPKSDSNSAGLSQEKLDLAIAFIRQNYHRKLRLADMALVTGLSEFYFDRLFKKSTGITPHQYLIEYRIKCAKQMLNKKNSTITEIARKCGFSTPSYFVNLFRKVVGVTPKVYRDKL